MGAELSTYDDDDMIPHPEPVHYILRNGAYVRHLGDAREFWPPSSSVFRSQAPPALEHADIQNTPGSLIAKSLSVVQSDRMLQLKGDVDAQEPIRVVLNFGTEDRVGFGVEGAGLGLGDDGIWLPGGLGQPWKAKPFRAGKYAAEDGSLDLTIEIHARDKAAAAKLPPQEHTEVRLVPRGPDEKPGYDLEVKRQYVTLEGAEYDLNELYGKCGADPTAGFGNECVICLIEERDTAILPCRHLCLCSSCADVMRLRSQTCPICRQDIKSLLQVEGSTAATGAGTPQPTPRSTLNTPRRSGRKTKGVKRDSGPYDGGTHRASTATTFSDPPLSARRIR